MSSFCSAKATHIFFSKKFQHICVSLDVNFNDSLTNDVVSFEHWALIFNTDSTVPVHAHWSLTVMLFNIAFLDKRLYSKYTKISYTKISDKMAYANSADPDQIAPDQDLHCLPFHLAF